MCSANSRTVVNYDNIVSRVLERLDNKRSSPEINFLNVGDYYPFLVRDFVLNANIDPLGNYILLELCIQNVGNQKWCSKFCYNGEPGGYAFRSCNPIYQFVRFQELKMFRDYFFSTKCNFCDRYLTKGVHLECNPFLDGVDTVNVPISYSTFFNSNVMKNISHR